MHYLCVSIDPPIFTGFQPTQPSIIIFFFKRPLMTVRVAGVAAQDCGHTSRSATISNIGNPKRLKPQTVPSKILKVYPSVFVRGSGVTDGGQGGKCPTGSLDVGSFLEMGPLNSAFFTF